MTDNASQLLHGGDVVPDVVARRWRPRDYLRVYVAENWDAYADVHDNLQRQGGLPASWSWAAFFIPSIWLVYRKRYAWALAVFLVMNIADRVLPGGAGTLVTLAMSVFLGVFGKALYIKSALADVARILAQGPDQHARVARVQAKGGCSDRAIMVIVCVVLVAWLALVAALAVHPI